MNIKLIGKPVMTTFVVFDGNEFPLSEVYASLEQINNTMEDDYWGDYSLRDYQLISQEVMDYFVKMGLVKNYSGPRMANLYCMKSANGIERLQNVLYKLDELNDVTTVDVREVVHGKWIEHEFESIIPYQEDENGDVVMHKYISYKCNLCGRTESKPEPYCNCGAKMDLE